MVEGCKCPPGVSILKYQLYQIDNAHAYKNEHSLRIDHAHEIPITTLQYSNMFLIPGPPILSNDHYVVPSRNYGDPNRDDYVAPSRKFQSSKGYEIPVKFGASFSVKVCTIFDTCTKFYSNTIPVVPSSNVTRDGVDMIDYGKKLNHAGHYLNAIMIVSNLIRRENIVPYDISKIAMADIVTYIVDWLKSPPAPSFRGIMTKDQAEILYHSIGQVLKLSNDTLIHRKAHSALVKVMAKAISYKAVPSVASADQLYQIMLSSVSKFKVSNQDRDHLQRSESSKRESSKISENSMRDRFQSSNDLIVLSAIRKSIKTLLESMAKIIPIGKSIELGKQRISNRNIVYTDDISKVYSVMVHDIELQDVTLSTYFHTNISTHNDNIRFENLMSENISLQNISFVNVEIIFGQKIKQLFNRPWTCDSFIREGLWVSDKHFLRHFIRTPKKKFKPFTFQHSANENISPSNISDAKKIFNNSLVGKQVSKGSICQSVIYSITVYHPMLDPYPNVFKGNEIFRLTPIVDVSIYSPMTGKEEEIEGFFDAITINVTSQRDGASGDNDINTRDGATNLKSSREHYLIKCLSWNEREQSWIQDDAHYLSASNAKGGATSESSTIAAGSAICWSGHLGTFASFRVPNEAIETGMIVGLTVASLLTLILIGLWMIYCVHKCNATESAQQLVVQRYE